MTELFDPAVLIFAGVLAAVMAAVCRFFGGMLGRRRGERRRRRAHSRIIELLEQKEIQPEKNRARGYFTGKKKWLFLEECARIADSTALTRDQREILANHLVRNRLDVRLIRDLHSRHRSVRSRAAVYLAFIPTQAVRVSLVMALETEQSHAVRLFLAASLTEMGETSAVPTIIDTLKGSSLRYQEAIWGLLSGFGDDLGEFIPILMRRKEKEIQFLLIHLATRHCTGALRDYIEALTDSRDLDVAQRAFRVLATVYASTLDHRRYLTHDDFLIRNLAAESLGGFPRTESLALLFDHLDDQVIRRSAVLALTALVRIRPQYLRSIMFRCLNERRPRARAALVDVLANYVDYLMEKLLSHDAVMVQKIIYELVRYEKTSEIINFLNRNANAEIERKVLAVFKVVLKKKPGLSGELLAFLDNRILKDLGLNPKKAETKGPAREENPNRPLLFLFLFVGAALIPLVCLILTLVASSGLTGEPPDVILRRFATFFNAAFAVYATALSSTYLVLLFFSVRGVRHQSRIDALVRHSLLFKDYILPSISIISPAYNEEATIVESVNALFNIHYPDYEIIIVNDGSTDRTLERLVSYFELERTDVFIHRYLNTREIRAVYANKQYPELLVLDKQNGGKADSLNAGINVARKEYFSGIDADSLLERDALSNLGALFLFSEKQVLAAGGNIFPVNGCTVRKGTLVKTRIPRRRLACFQTIEYIRAFMAGRVGWAQLKLLLIISGAFGVFHRRSVINAHGYLTQSEQYGKDTVGEDMELVVRLSREARENHVPFSVVYGYNANCWTEIPERLKTFVGQRDRWQRGLLDIMTFHSGMFFNPVYGRIGLVGFPYFLFFEILGPWFEVEGLAVFIASLALGWMGVPLLLLVFTATVALGLLVSILSLSIAEYKSDYFPLRDKLRLFFYAFLENFGVRQLIGLIRIRGFLRMFGKSRGWGKMERRGWKSLQSKGIEETRT